MKLFHTFRLLWAELYVKMHVSHGNPLYDYRELGGGGGGGGGVG